MHLKPGEVHVWSVNLMITPEQLAKQEALLSSDEIKRAYRFHFPHHQQRFIAGRSTLRQILSVYLEMAPEAIAFDYTDHEKPHLAHTPTLQFNLSHSDEIAVYAVTENYAVGIDIEKTQQNYHEAVAFRYYNTSEQQLLLNTLQKERNRAFYQLWARKEAVVKAVGKGLAMPLSSFAVTLSPIENLMFDNLPWTIVELDIHPDYQAALASPQNIKRISFWKYIDQKPHQTSQFAIDI